MTQCIDVTQTVDSTFGDLAIVRVVTDSAHLVMPGAPGTMPGTLRDMLRGMTAIQLMDSRARVLSTTVSGPNAPAGATGGMTSAMDGLSGRLPAFPEQPVRVGDTWADSQPVVLATPGSRGIGWVRTDNRLDSLDQGIAVVTASGSARYDVISPQLTMTVTGTSSGRMRWDLERGRLERAVSRASGQLRIAALAQTMPFRITMAMVLQPPGPLPACEQ
jgi:hypothetical protein